MQLVVVSVDSKDATRVVVKDALMVDCLVGRSVALVKRRRKLERK